MRVRGQRADRAGRTRRAERGCSGTRREELAGQLIEILVPDASKAAHPGQRAGHVADPAPRLWTRAWTCPPPSRRHHSPGRIALTALETGRGPGAGRRPRRHRQRQADARFRGLLEAARTRWCAWTPRADRAGKRPGRAAVRVPARGTGRAAGRDPGPRREQGRAPRPARRVRGRPPAPADGRGPGPVRPPPRRHHLPRRDRPVRPRHRPGHPGLRRHPRRHPATAGTRRSQADQPEPAIPLLLPSARPADATALAGRIQHRPDRGLRRYPR